MRGASPREITMCLRIAAKRGPEHERDESSKKPTSITLANAADSTAHKSGNKGRQLRDEDGGADRERLVCPKTATKVAGESKSGHRRHMPENWRKLCPTRIDAHRVRDQCPNMYRPTPKANPPAPGTSCSIRFMSNSDANP